MLRQTLARTAAALVAAAALTACSGVTDAPREGTAASAGYPVTVTHRLGTTVIPAAPTRVVALGVPDLDVAAALGVVTVAALASPYTADGVWPWDAGKVDPARTTLLTGTPGQLDLEKIAALRPDLILAHSTAGVDDIYPKLAEIAPTVVDSRGVLADPWQDETIAIGTALGRADQARTLVADVERRLADTASAHPGLSGAGYVIGWAREPGTVTVTGRPDDITAALFGALGMHLPDSVTALPRLGGGNSGAGAAVVPFEQLSMLDTDLLLVAAGSPELGAQLASNPLFTRLTAVREGRYESID
ncbi:MAG: ABC transporter substrate-binding protein, partial [Microbacterium sp.]|nr:ABC transporter substrate-binding protein [Microbacterium sp.]